MAGFHVVNLTLHAHDIEQDDLKKSATDWNRMDIIIPKSSDYPVLQQVSI